MKAGTRLLASLSLCAVATMMAAMLTTQSSQAVGKATIQTDLADYPPKTQVNVTGSGWLQGEVVELTFTETATTPPGGYTDGPFVFYATADDLGNIANGDFYTDQHDIGVHFLLTAKGVVSGRWAQTTFTDGLADLFWIDGDATTPAGSTAHDWDQVYADYLVRLGQGSGTGLTSGTGSIQFTSDGVGSAQDDAFANSPKDVDDITTWKWSRHAVSSPKTDLAHGFAAAYQESGYPDYGGTHTVLFVGTDRYASGSNSAISMWFLQHPIGARTDGTFCTRTGPACKATDVLETHMVGDLLIQASLGSSPTVAAYQWVGGKNPLQPLTLDSSQYTQAINSAAITVPWPFIDSSGSSKPLAQEFFEVGLDLNRVFHAANADLPDFSSFIITTRTSNSQTATLSDFILGNISTVPNIGVDKVADAATVSAGGQVKYTVTVRNVGVGDVTGATLNDPLPPGAGNDLDWTLAGDSSVFQISGSAGNQTLSFVSPQTLPNNSAPLIAHVVATSTSHDLGKLTNHARVDAAGESTDFQDNNDATADLVIVPKAVDDTYTTALNTAKVVSAAEGVLSNDGTPLTSISSILVTGPAHGTLTLAPGGSFTYTPANGWFGSDSFTYKDKDTFGNFSNIATVTINIGNNTPVAANDAYSVDEDATLTVPVVSGVLNNDTDGDNNVLAVATPAPVSGPSHGTLTLNSNGSFTYNPYANYNGSDSFTYKATDGAADSNTATVSLTVNPVNDAPQAVNDSASTSEDTAVAIAVLTNDTDVDQNTLSVKATSISAPAHGTATLITTGPDAGKILYTPEANYHGTDSFTYQATDGTADSNVATVTVTVSSVNDAPVAVNDSASTTEDTAVRVAVIPNDTDLDGDALAVKAGSISAPAHGTATLITSGPDAGKILYTPDANYNGPDSFTYRATDGTANSNIATVSITVNPANDAPSVSVDVVNGATSLAVNEGNTSVNTGTFADIDSSSVSITATVNGQPYGTIAQSSGPAGAWTWTYPTTDELGPVTVTITATDGEGASTSTTFSFTVLNVAPAIVMSNGTIVLTAGDSFTRPGSFLDPGDDTWSGTVNYGDGKGVQPLTLSGKTFSLASDAYAPGDHVVTVSVDDGDGGIDTMSFHVLVGALPAIAAVEALTAVSSSVSHDFTVTATSNAVHSYSIKWGDGTAAETGSTSLTDGSGSGTFTGSHPYAHKGTYNVFVTVTDSQTGISGTVTFTVTVN
jgi:VCBS repeat-containing protein